jgi:DNA mismatch repair protein MutL
MSGIIQLLPDHVANQIAAGEVVQRPASAVKELLENAVDSGARSIQLIIKDGGRTLIQVIDNGSGMDAFDARLCFLRHATSKLKQADDLWNIRTMGFRGEALASIAAVAQVEMHTRLKDQETGTRIHIEGSEVISQDEAACPVGTSISVRNLFYNVPARRNFLKSNTVETRHIYEEFYRVALSFPDRAFSLINQGDEVHRLMGGSFKQRIAGIFGNSINEKLIQVREENTPVKITGFIGKPENARKTRGEQYFFINNRFIKHPYLHHAVQSAFQDIIAHGEFPVYFIRFEVDPSSIDINIHPTKTEIKFEDERTAYGILRSAIRKALGAYSLSPSLDFDAEMQYVPLPNSSTEIKAPEIKVNPDYNPFATSSSTKQDNSRLSSIRWEELTQSTAPIQTQLLPSDSENAERSMPWLLHGMFICSQIKSGMMLIHLEGARERILYERFLNRKQSEGAAQMLLFPVILELNPQDFQVYIEVASELRNLGFECEEFGINTLKINAVPAEALDANAQTTIEELLEAYKNDQATSGAETLARTLARIGARSAEKPGPSQMLVIIDKLFSCENSGFTPFGKPITTVMPIDEIAGRFK